MSPWDMACDLLRAHVRSGESCERAINRLWTEGTRELRPWISRGAVDVYFENWVLGRLAALGAGDEASDGAPGQAGDLPVVVRWQGRDCLIAGRRRIRQVVELRDPGTHEVLVLDIGNIAGDI